MDVVRRFERVMAAIVNDMPSACFVDPDHLNTWIFRTTSEHDMDISIFIDRDTKSVLFSVIGIRGSVAMDLIDSPKKLFGKYKSYFRSERVFFIVMNILHLGLFPVFDTYILQVK